MLETMFIGIFYLFESFVFVYMLRRLLPRRWNTHFLFLVLITFAAQLAKYLITDNLIFRFFLNFIADLTVMAVFYKGTFAEKFIYSLVFYDFLFLCDSLTISLFDVLGWWELQTVTLTAPIEIIMSIVSHLFLVIFIFCFIKLWPADLNKQMKLFPIPVAIFLILFLFTPFKEESPYYNHPEWLFITMAVFLAVAMWCFLAAERNRYNKESIEILYHEREKYFDEMQKHYEYIAPLVHDTKHVLNIMEALGYTDDTTLSLKEKISTANFGFTGNTVIDAVIHNKKLNSAPDIVFDFSGRLPKVIPWIAFLDLCSLWGNALENAIEATEKASIKIIKAEFSYRENWLLIHIQNPVSKAPKQDKAGNLISDKGTGHGFGFQSMVDIINKYNGFKTVNITDSFELSITLQNLGGNKK